MSVDKFGRGCPRFPMMSRRQRRAYYRFVNNNFIRRDGGNTATNDIDLDSHKLRNVANPT